jgi:hypothetical protein
MQLRINITYDDGSTVDASAATVDLVAWERQTAKPLNKLLTERFLSDMLWLAWHVLHRRKSTDKDFDAWLEQVDTMTLGETDEETVPLDESPSTGESSR